MIVIVGIAAFFFGTIFGATFPRPVDEHVHKWGKWIPGNTEYTRIFGDRVIKGLAATQQHVCEDCGFLERVEVP